MARYFNILSLVVLAASLVLTCNLWGVSEVIRRCFLPEKYLIIGILSSRNHFEQRQALRDTWVGHITNTSELNDKLLVKFLVGRESCNIPPEYRDDPYSCKELNISYNHQRLQRDIEAFQVADHHNDESDCHILTKNPIEVIGFDFKVNHDIVIDKLGVFVNDLDSISGSVKVMIYDTWRREPVAISRFSPHQPGVSHNGFNYRPVEQYILPKDFEGTIVVEGLNYDQQNVGCMNVSRNGKGLISIKQFFRYGKEGGKYPLDTQKVLPGSLYPIGGNFIYRAHNYEKLYKWRNDRSDKEKKHLKEIENETKKLNEELSKHNDLLLLDVIDTYRNLPQKVLKFYQWVHSSVNYQFVIKTDDDCFVNIQNILSAFEPRGLHKAKKTWWGQFRTSWAVEHDGKWAELDYPCSGYPSFACGAGSLLTADLVKWIAINEPYLHSYQGEDVSQGIWMSSILPFYDHDSNWVCDDACHKAMYVSAEHSSEELRTMWKNLKQCNNPCLC